MSRQVMRAQVRAWEWAAVRAAPGKPPHGPRRARRIWAFEGERAYRFWQREFHAEAERLAAREGGA